MRFYTHFIIQISRHPTFGIEWCGHYSPTISSEILCLVKLYVPTKMCQKYIFLKVTMHCFTSLNNIGYCTAAIDSIYSGA